MDTRQIAPFGLRMPDDLKAKVRAAAAEEGRSMNAQIVQHLRAIYHLKPQEEGARDDQCA